MKLLPHTAVVALVEKAGQRPCSAMSGMTLDAAIAEILVAINALPSATEWQPIETAPKDGTRVLLFDKDRNPNTLIAAADRFDRNCWWGDSTNSGKSIVWKDATHWQPLPASPETCQDKEL